MTGRRPGPPPLPANVIKIRGNRSQLSEAELAEREASTVKPRPITARAPAGLTKLEKECWDLHAPELHNLQLLTVLDIASFRLLVCQPYEMAITALDAMRPRTKTGKVDRRKKGYEVVIEGTEGLRRHPGFTAWRQSIESYRAGCRDFGLTPSARVGLRPGYVPAPAGEPDDEDDDSAFFGT